jgi:hypothetical protein
MHSEGWSTILERATSTIYFKTLRENHPSGAIAGVAIVEGALLAASDVSRPACGSSRRRCGQQNRNHTREMDFARGISRSPLGEKRSFPVIPAPLSRWGYIIKANLLL